MKICPKCGKQLPDTALFCGECGSPLVAAAAEVEAEAKKKVVCPSCGAKLKKGAKFCGECGATIADATTPVENAANNTNTGKPESETPSAGKRKDFSLVGGYIHWNVLPGQIAVKIDENDIAAYGKVKGVSIQDGVKALLFVQGKLIAELEGGNYAFKSMGVEEFAPAKTVKKEAPFEEKLESKKAKKKKTVKERALGFISNITSHLPGKKKERAEAAGLTTRIPANIPPVSVVLVRTTEFPFVFDFKDVATANLHSDVGLSFMCEINNINAFYASLLVDNKVVGFETITKAVETLIQNIVTAGLSQVSPEQVNGNLQLQETLLGQISAAVSNVYSYLEVTKIITLSSTNEDLEVIRRKREELYISELELNELTHRNNFLNRLQDEENSQLLQEARTKEEFDAAMEEIDEQHEMRMEEREKFRMILETQKKLRLAKNDDELEAALLEFRKNKLLRDEEIDNLEFLIKHNQTVRDMDESQALALATMENEFTLAKARSQNEFDLKKLNALNDFDFRKITADNEFDLNKAQIQRETELDKLKLQREMEVGNARIENELNRQRMQDEYTNSRFEAELRQRKMQKAQEADEDRQDAELAMMLRRNKFEMDEAEKNAEFNRDQAEKDNDLRRSEAEAMGQHQRDLEMQKSQQDFELNKIAAEDKKFEGRSADEIRALREDLSADVMKARAEADGQARVAEAQANAAIAQNGKLEEKNQQMMEMMQKMLAEKNADKDNQQAMMMQMMQMMNANNQQNTQNTNENMQKMMAMMTQLGMNGQNAAASANNAANTAKVEGAQNMADLYKQMAQQTRDDANAAQDRNLHGLETTINAVGGAMKQPNVVYQQTPVTPQQEVPVSKNVTNVMQCPDCGEEFEPGQKFCFNCGKKFK